MTSDRSLVHRARDGVSDSALQPLSQPEAERQRSRILQLYDTIRRSQVQFCLALADFFNANGNEALADEHGNPLPWAYWEAAFGVSRQRIHQWISAGRAWRGLSTKVDAEMTEQLTETHLRLLGDVPEKDRLPVLNDAKERAHQDHEQKQTRRQAEGRRVSRAKPRLRQKHVRDAIKARLGTGAEQKRGARRTKPQAAGVPLTVGESRRVVELLEETLHAAHDAGCPAELLDQIEAALEGARAYHRRVSKEAHRCRS